MKKFSKIILALAIGSAALAPGVERSYADETAELEVDEYLSNYNELEETIKQASEAKNLYSYLNASKYNRDDFDSRLNNAIELKDKVNLANIDKDTNGKLVDANYLLSESMKRLDGKITDMSKLNELIEDDTNFVKTDLYKNAPADLQEKYVEAVKSGRDNYGKDAKKVSQALIDIEVVALEKAKADIKNHSEELGAKDKLLEEIKNSRKLLDNKDSYTEESFKAFKNTLRLVETSIEDASKEKSAKEYEDLRSTLESARLALVKSDKISQDELVKRLKKSMKRNEITMEAAKLLMRIAPDVVKPHKAELDTLIKRSEELMEKANSYLNWVKDQKVKG